MNTRILFIFTMLLGGVTILRAAENNAVVAQSSTADATTVNDNVGLTRSHDLSQVPVHTVVFNGEGNVTLHDRVMSALYDTSDLHFQDPGVPRYLLVDKSGTTALGIGGYVEGVVQGDFKGAIDGNGFTTYDIKVPADPALRQRLGADASHTTLFLKLVRHTQLGVLNAYVQSNFTGDDGGYGMKLKQAYISLGNVTAGLTNSTFVDPSAGVPTIDYQGPSGEITAKNILLRYRYKWAHGLSMAVSAEMPKATLTPVGGYDQEINQRIPDFPAYLQYDWGSGSHVRLSGIVRTLSYRDLVANRNRMATGYGVQLSGVYDCMGLVDVYYAGAYGRGIGRYVNDLAGQGMDLIASQGRDGTMIAPRTLGIVAGARINLGDNFFVSSSYSLNRLYDQEQLGGDTYKRANYVVANAFYTPISSLQVGVEYLHGTRKNVDNSSANANRVNLMVKYSF